MLQPAAASSLRRASAPAQSLACFAAQRLSARAVTEEGTAQIMGFSKLGILFRPKAQRIFLSPTRYSRVLVGCDDQGSTVEVISFTILNIWPNAAGAFRSSDRLIHADSK